MSWQSPETINWTDGLAGAFYYVNSVSNGWVTNMMLISIYVICLMGYYRSQEDFAGGMAVGGIVTFIMGLFFFISGLMTWIIFGFTIAGAVIGFVVLIIERNRSSV
jgi:hypothetical protein